MPTYNLITEPWIPVSFLNGTTAEIGLREAVLRAHDIREIESDSPVEVAAINRLLLALTIRIFPETENEESWFDRWYEGRFPSQQIDEYFEKWKDRFDLFHPQWPFYQVRTDIGQSILQVGMLRLDEASNTSKLFSHADLRQDETRTFAEAARGVIGIQFAAIGGLLSLPFKTGNRGTPFVSGCVFWLRGANLFQALLLNAPPTETDRMGGYREDDIPAWEQPTPILTERRPHKGFLDYLTFQHRRITLETNEDEAADHVTAVRITGGDAEEPMPLEDPHMCVVTIDPTKPPGRLNLKKDRALWRDAILFMTLLAGNSNPPKTFQWVAAHDRELGTNRFLIDVMGLRTRGANDGTILFWRRETMPLFSRFLQLGNSAGTNLMRALDHAEKQGQTVGRGCYITAARLLYHKTDSLSKDESQDARNWARALDAENRYWTSLEQPFYNLLRRLAEADTYDQILRDWGQTIHRAALSSFDNATRALNANANQIHARVEGRSRIRPVLSYRNLEAVDSTIES